MVYVKLFDLNDSNVELYAIMSDSRGELISIVDTNCQPASLPTEHIFGETIPTPPCAQP